MSFLTSTGLARPQYVIAIVGATGNLGRSVASVLVGSYKPYFSSVVGLVRNPSSEAAISLASAGVELRKVSGEDSADTVADVLKGVDVVVNVLNTDAASFKNIVAEAVVKAGVSVYILSEFGIDHRLNDFPGYDNFDWVHKRENEEVAHKLAGDKTKVISIYNGGFLDGSIGPWFGFDIANNTFTAIGDPNQRISLTSKKDIGRAVAELSLLSLGRNAATVPDHVRIAGDTASFEDVAALVHKVRKGLGKPDPEIIIKSEDLQAFKQKVKERQAKEPKSDPVSHLRVLFGENKVDFSKDNSNEVVNPDGKVWTWTTLEDYLQEIGERL